MMHCQALQPIPLIHSLGYHNNFVYKNKYYVIGGVSAEYDKQGTQKKFPQSKTYNSWTFLHVYDLNDSNIVGSSSCWSRVKTSGILCPDRLENTAIVVRNDTLVVFGGWTGNEHTNRMWSLDLVTLKWREILFDPLKMRPSPRAGHTMNLVNGGNSFVLFGGQGNRVTKSNELSMKETKQSVKYDHDIYNNQTLLYDFISDSWSLQEDDMTSHTLSSRPRTPSPRAYHSCTEVGDHFLFLFGGRNSEIGALDDLWTFDKRNFEWTKVDTRSTPSSCPVIRPSPRYRHTANLVPNTSSIIFMGGWEKSGTLVGNNNQPCFVYDTISAIWTVVSLLNWSCAGHASSSIFINNNDDGRLRYCVLLSGGEISDNNDKEGCQRILTNQIFFLKWECSLSALYC